MRFDMELKKLFDRRRRRGYYVFCDYTPKNVRRFARMSERVYQESITSTHIARRVDRRFGAIEEDDTGRSGRKYFATNIKVKVIGKIRWTR